MGPAPEDNRVSADEALARLIDGNRRFLRGEARSAAFRRETLADLAKAQRPYATDPRLQRFARAARVDFRYRPG